MRNLIFFCTMLVGVQAHANTGSSCAIIQNDDKRLLCYDLIFKIAPVATPTEGVGAWDITSTKSKIDDSSKVFLTLDNNNAVTDRFYRKKTVTLIITCRENTTDFMVNFNTFMVSTRGRGEITYRIDKEKAKKINTITSNDSNALGLWSGRLAIPFIRKLLGKKLLLIRATPYSESAITATFNITGIENAIKPLAKACSWKP